MLTLVAKSKFDAALLQDNKFKIRAFKNNTQGFEELCGWLGMEWEHSLSSADSDSLEHVEWCRQIRLIPLKKSERTFITYLEKSEMDALLNTPDRTTDQGQSGIKLNQLKVDSTTTPVN